MPVRSSSCCRIKGACQLSSLSPPALALMLSIHARLGEHTYLLYHAVSKLIELKGRELMGQDSRNGSQACRYMLLFHHQPPG